MYADNQSLSSHSENLLSRHIWSIIKIAQWNEPQKTETPLNNGRKITVIINFHTISWIGNLLNCVEIPFLKLSEKDG